MKSYHYIYEITNLVNGKTYRGKHSTDNLDREYLGSGIAITRAVKKYGSRNFKKKIVAWFDDAEAVDFAEELYIPPEFVALKSNYNLIPGGTGGAAPFMLMSKE